MVPLASNPVDTILAKAHDDSARSDFESARINLHRVIDGGMEAINRLGELADQSQSARVYEVYSTLMKTIVDANKDLLEIQKKIRDISAADAPMNEKAQTINNNLFVGSTAELQNVIERMRGEK
jgi:hypothetical protein